MPVKYVKWLVGSYMPGDASSRDTLKPTARYQPGPVKQLIILEHSPNPSTDYYIKPRLTSDSVAATIVDISLQRPDQFAITEGIFVVIVRYLTRNWGNYLLRHQHLLRGVALFMDDDMLAARQSPRLPLRYRHKIHSLFERQLDQLGSLCSELWVSTPLLAETYAHCTPRVIPPLPLGHDTAVPLLTYFYHGSAAHQAEITWLQEVVAQVQVNTTLLNFIIIGGAEVNRLFRALPRVMVIHPLPWDSYCHTLPTLSHHIGLVPLLPGSFNNGRSHTKFFDLTRLGSVGIYSDTPPYNSFIRDGIDGILLKNDPNLWATTIIQLAKDAERRNELLRQARLRVEKLLRETPGIFSSP